MENRLLIAFLLSLFVFFGWGYILSKIQGPPPAKQKHAQKKKETVPQSPIHPSTETSEVPGLAGLETEPLPGTSEVFPESSFMAAEEKMVKVSNGNITFLLSNKGATLKEVLLNKYKEADGSPINLVQHSEGALWPLAIESNDETVNRIIQNAAYEISVDSIELSPFNPKGTLTMQLKHSSGLEVFRKFTFYTGKYLFDVETRITPGSFTPKNLIYTVYWGPGLGGHASSHTDHFVFAGPTTLINNERVENPPDEITDMVRHRGGLLWTAFQNKYFATALIPGQGIKSAVVRKKDDQAYVGLELESVQSATSSTFWVYSGTKELRVLEKEGHKLVRLLDYGWMGNKFAFLVKPLLYSLQYFYDKVNNYGWAIIIITIIIKILFFPLTHKSFKSMKGLQKVQPYVKIIQERNKDDRTKMNEEMLELYKKHKVNPLGGCLPMLLQIPVFIALYHALFFSIELRGAPFIGWIHDLSIADPYYVTPVLMGASMFLQQKLSPAVADPMQQKIMMMLPIVFTFLFMSFPAGLVIYWTVNNVLTIAQQYYIYKIAKD